MRIFSEREITRIGEMLLSNDKDMRELGKVLFNKRVRFSTSFIMLLHCILFIVTTTIISYIVSNYEGLFSRYWMPIISSIIVQIIFSIVHVINIYEFRKCYDRQL